MQTKPRQPSNGYESDALPTHRNPVRRVGAFLTDSADSIRFGRAALLLVGVFAISRALYFILGVRFDADTVNYLWQLLDPAVLTENLWESLWYLHAQPPLFNLLVGGSIVIFGEHFGAALNLLFLACGIVMYLSTFALMRRLEVPGRLALATTIFFMVSPAAVLYENYLFYSYPIMAIGIVSFLFLHRFVTDGRLLDAAGFFFGLALLALTRSVYNPVWYLLLAGVVVLLRPELWRKVVLAGTIPLVAGRSS